jgi:site-specific recombinase XerD
MQSSSSQTASAPSDVERIEALLRLRGLSEKTIANYINALRQFEGRVGKPVSQASVEDLANFLSSLPYQSRYAYTIALKTTLRLLGREDMARLLRVPRKQRRKYTIIPEEKVREIAERLWWEGEHKLSIAIALGYELALRVSEICSLKLKDIDLSEWTVTVERAKGRRVYRLPIVSQWVKDLLLKYIATHPRHTEYLIWSRKKPHRYSAATMSDMISRALKRFGFPDARPHDLRHSRATNLLRMGLDIRAVQLLLGHASIAQTEVYTHLTAVDLRKMIEEAYKRHSTP